MRFSRSVQPTPPPSQPPSLAELASAAIGDASTFVGNLSTSSLILTSLCGFVVLKLLAYVFKALRSSRERIATSNDLGRRLVLITGCDSGFGQGLVEAAVDAGFEVVAACYTEDGAHHYSGSPSVTTVVADLTKAGDMATVVEVTTRTAGPRGLYALVNNAGLVLPGHVEWAKPTSYEATMALNFHAPVSLTYHLLPALKAAKGRVVNVTSVDGFIPLPSNAAYNSSKHALEAYSDTLRCEMLPWGVRVVVIEPATMRTPLALSFAEAWLKGFKQAPAERRAPYGDAWANAYGAQTKQGIEDLAANPALTVRALLDALTLADPPTRTPTGKAAHLLFKPLSYLPDRMRDRVLYAMTCAPGAPPPLALSHPRPPKTRVVSHVTIRVRSLAISVPWYEKWGFERIGPSEGGGCFLKSGPHRKWQPLVLLVEDPAMAPRGESYEAGMTRLCVYVTRFAAAVAKLEAQGLTPMAPPCGKTEEIAAFKDPDGFVVYLIVFHMPLAPIFIGARWWNRVRDPQLFHWTVNVTDAPAGLKAFDALGFRSLYDAGPTQVQFDLLPAFGLSATATKIAHIRLAQLPACSFIATIMEWVEPRSEKKGAEKLNALSISCEDVDAELRRAREAGLRVEPPTVQRYPVLGEALVGACFVDDSRVEFVRFLDG